MKLMILAALSGMQYLQQAGAEASTGGGSADKPSKSKPEVLKVKMDDGREVEFVGKRKLLKETVIDGAAVKVRLDFRNGASRLFTCPDSILLKAAGHGLEQKLGDETAGTEEVDDMVMEVDELMGRLSAGEWNTKREGGGFGGASILVKALVEVTQKSIDEVKAFLKAKVDAGTTYQKLNDAFSEDDTVGPVIKRIKKEKAGESGVDTKALLGGIAAIPAAAPATTPAA